MSGTTRTSADLDPRRRRLLYRAWHRGIREMDLIMGRFADAEIGDLSDRDLFKWLTGEAETPSNYDTAVWQRVRAFHRHDAPIHS
jgi:antitoxin CptB